MEINILQLIDGAKKARGLTVVIDVFRAFSNECYMMHQGAEKILAVGDIDLAYQLKKENPEAILVGERNERPPKGFDFGNSPNAILSQDLSGKTIVHTTSSGTQGLVNATHADELITGSFVNAGAIVQYIQQQNPTHLSLCCMGYATQYPVEEDTFCAEYIKSQLEGTNFDYQEKIDIIKATSGARFFNDDTQGFAPKEDFYHCTELNKFDFVLKAEKIGEGVFEMRKINI